MCPHTHAREHMHARAHTHTHTHTHTHSLGLPASFYLRIFCTYNAVAIKKKYNLPTDTLVISVTVSVLETFMFPMYEYIIQQEPSWFLLWTTVFLDTLTFSSSPVCGDQGQSLQANGQKQSAADFLQWRQGAFSLHGLAFCGLHSQHDRAELEQW